MSAKEHVGRLGVAVGRGVEDPAGVRSSLGQHTPTTARQAAMNAEKPLA